MVTVGWKEDGPERASGGQVAGSEYEMSRGGRGRYQEGPRGDALEMTGETGRTAQECDLECVQPDTPLGHPDGSQAVVKTDVSPDVCPGATHNCVCHWVSPGVPSLRAPVVSA